MHSEKIDEYAKKNNTALQGGGQDRIKAQHDKGKLTARERINLLLDEGTFTEMDPLVTHHYHEYDMQKKKFFTDGVVCGYGTVNGRQIFVFAYDFTVLGGTLSKMGAKKITKLTEHALKTGCPIIGIKDICKSIKTHNSFLNSSTTRIHYSNDWTSCSKCMFR